jgi:YidC/Oxa1 family membrane protein insertase
MDSNKTFLFMVAIAAIFIIVLLVKPNILQNNTVTTIPTTTTSIKTDQSEDKKIQNSNSEYEFIEIKQEKTDPLIYENVNYKIVLDPKDAIIKNAYIKVNETNSVDLVQGNENLGALEFKFGSWNNNITISKLIGTNAYYNYSRDGDKFTFICKFKNKTENIIYTVKKTFTFFDKENVFRLDIDVSNDKNKAIKFDESGIAFSLGWGPLLGLDSKEKNYNPIYDHFAFFNGKKSVNIPINDKKIKDNKNFYITNKNGSDTWIASNDHFFISFLYPDNQNYKYFYDYRDTVNKNYYCGLSRDTSEKSNLSSQFFIYVGPKENSILTKYNKLSDNSVNLQQANFQQIKNYFGNHFFTNIVEKTIGLLLTLIYDLVKNYGLAIIIITFIIKLLISPLTHKSMVSQEKMSKLQPKLKELQAKYKDKPEDLNKETMNLYKKEGINPFAGCLPLLLQMPLLTAMYYLLANLYELNGATFLWIKDLSKPDSVYTFSQYFTIPFVNIGTLNIMPIIMTIVSVISTLSMPDTSGNKQAKMMMWMMPLIFFFLFYNVSSGLVLYWTVMNILNMVQQIYINYFRKKIIKKI